MSRRTPHVNTPLVSATQEQGCSPDCCLSGELIGQNMSFVRSRPIIPLVLWCSWLSLLSNNSCAQAVPGSSPGGIIFLFCQDEVLFARSYNCVSHPSFGTSSAKSIMTHCHLLVFGRRSQEWFASPDDNQHGLIIRGLVMDSFSPTTGIHKQPRRQLLTSTLGILFVQFSICNTCLCLAVWRTSRTTIATRQQMPQLCYA